MSNAVRFPTILSIVLVLVLSACARPEATGGLHDPYEVNNRNVHEANREIDRNNLRPTAYSYGENVPEPVRRGVSNFATNLSLPGDVINNLLQFRIGDALQNTGRFLVNSTVGLGGILDPGSKIGLERQATDFGETLYVWGVGEGAYLELPLLGPSTTRDAIGPGVDVFLDPVGSAFGSPEIYAVRGSKVLNRLENRFRFGSTIDSVLYESADSYTQTQLFYLENRRFELSGGVEGGNAELYDIYEESFE